MPQLNQLLSNINIPLILQPRPTLLIKTTLLKHQHDFNKFKVIHDFSVANCRPISTRSILRTCKSFLSNYQPLIEPFLSTSISFPPYRNYSIQINETHSQPQSIHDPKARSPSISHDDKKNSYRSYPRSDPLGYEHGPSNPSTSYSSSSMNRTISQRGPPLQPSVTNNSRNQIYYEQSFSRIIHKTFFDGVVPKINFFNKIIAYMNKNKNYYKTLRITSVISKLQQEALKTKRDDVSEPSLEDPTPLLEPDTSTFNGLIQAQLGLGNDILAIASLEHALKYSLANTTTFNIFLRHLVSKSRYTAFNDIYQLMKTSSFKPDSLTFLILFQFHFKQQQIDQIMQLFEDIYQNHRHHLSSYLYNPLLIMLVQAKALHKAIIVFSKLLEHYTIMNENNRKRKGRAFDLKGKKNNTNLNDQFAPAQHSNLGDDAVNFPKSFDLPSITYSIYPHSLSRRLKSDPAIVGSFLLMEALCGRNRRVLILFNLLSECRLQPQTQYFQMVLIGFLARNYYAKIEYLLRDYLNHELIQRQRIGHINLRELCCILLAHCTEANNLDQANRFFTLFMDMGVLQGSPLELEYMAKLHLSEGDETSALQYLDIMLNWEKNHATEDSRSRISLFLPILDPKRKKFQADLGLSDPKKYYELFNLFIRYYLRIGNGQKAKLFFQKYLQPWRELTLEQYQREASQTKHSNDPSEYMIEQDLRDQSLEDHSSDPPFDGESVQQEDIGEKSSEEMEEDKVQGLDSSDFSNTLQDASPSCILLHRSLSSISATSIPEDFTTIKLSPSPSVKKDYLFELDLVWLKICANIGDSTEARLVFDQFIQRSIQPTFEMCHLILQSYIVQGDSKKAILMFEEMQENGIAPNTSCYNDIASIYANRGDFEKTRQHLEQMKSDHINYDARSFDILMVAYNQAKKWQNSLSILKEDYQWPIQLITESRMQRLAQSSSPLSESVINPIVDTVASLSAECSGEEKQSDLLIDHQRDNQLQDVDTSKDMNDDTVPVSHQTLKSIQTPSSDPSLGPIDDPSHIDLKALPYNVQSWHTNPESPLPNAETLSLGFSVCAHFHSSEDLQFLWDASYVIEDSDHSSILSPLIHPSQAKSETIQTFPLIYAAITSAAFNKPLSIQILQRLVNILANKQFEISFDQSRSLIRLLRHDLNLITQFSPYYPLFEKFNKPSIIPLSLAEKIQLAKLIGDATEL